ncbi:GNAT family N-acetyltransferase [Microbulbifer hainanensis]|uniref:GNAT family N-acetyltransferase n=1 Tax=Microbulbifer hainanensis TaxID=2735675 RepID=UPI0018677D5E|nr:GNAT family N-acetyltransferase [Microbulbifer hainanensis]
MLETERLLLRKFTLDDAEEYFQLNANADVVRYTGQAPFTSVDEAVAVLKSAPLRDYQIHGFGRLACINKRSGRLIGFCGLKYLAELDEIDIGYRFLPEFWGRGLATESSLPVMEYGRNVLGLKRIIGLVEPDNIGSVNVLKKLGLAFERKVSLDPAETEMDLYA